MAISHILEAQQGNIYTMLPVMDIPMCQRQQLLSTAESSRKSKKTILPIKSYGCEKNSIKKASVNESNSNTKECYPYWTDFCSKQSSRLWLPTENVLQASVLKSLNIDLKEAVEKSWFSTHWYTNQNNNLPSIFSASLVSDLNTEKDSESTLRKSRKIRLYPTKTQKQIFLNWFGASRFSYNRGVEFLKQPGTKANWKAIKTGILNALPEWADKTPYQIKSLAIKDACKAVSNAKIKYKKTKEFNTVRYRTKNDPIQSCYIPKSALRQGGIYPTLSEGSVLTTEKLPKDYQDSRLMLRNNEWYLCVPAQELKQTNENQGRVVSIDPGVRTFLTFYSEDGCGKLGVSTLGVILRLVKNIDNMISLKAKTSSKYRFKRRNLNNAIKRARQRLTNLVDELHWKCANFLTSNFDVILIPALETGKLAERTKRKLRRNSVRQMLTLSHCKFLQRLKYKANQRNKTVLVVNEAYTSKTVSWTGEINHKLGGAKTIKSMIGGQKMDRDYNGARGIFLRALGDLPILGCNITECIGNNITTPLLVNLGREPMLVTSVSEKRSVPF